MATTNLAFISAAAGACLSSSFKFTSNICVAVMVVVTSSFDVEGILTFKRYIDVTRPCVTPFKVLRPLAAYFVKTNCRITTSGTAAARFASRAAFAQ